MGHKFFPTEIFPASLLVNTLVAAVPVENPWEATNAHSLDSITLDSWSKQNCWTNVGKAIIDSGNSSFLSSDPSEVSFLWFLWYTHCGGGYESMIDGAQESRIKGGAGQISTLLAKKLGMENIHLNTAVLGVENWNSTHMTVKTSSETFHCKKIVIAVPPLFCGKISFSPSLPLLRDGLHDRVPMGW